jgi:uncharacterized protein YxjI
MASHIFETRLAAFTPPLGPQPPNPAFYSPNQVTLQMKEKIFSLTGDDFTVQTVEGLHVCKVKGKLISIHGKKAFADMAGQEIFDLKSKTLALFKSFKGTSPVGHDFEVKGHLAIGKSKSTCHFKNFSNGQEIELEIRGDWFDRSAQIIYGDLPVARISRSFVNGREVFGDKQTVRHPLPLCDQNFIPNDSSSTSSRLRPTST